MQFRYVISFWTMQVNSNIAGGYIVGGFSVIQEAEYLLLRLCTHIPGRKQIYTLTDTKTNKVITQFIIE